MILNIRDKVKKVYISEAQCRLLSEGNDSRYSRCGFEMLVGIPGCGKSTYLRKVSSPNVLIVCPDDIRRELTGNISDQSRNGDVWMTAEERIYNGLSDGRYVILDATNVGTRNRVGLLNKVKGMKPGISCYATVFDCNPDVSKERIGRDIENGVDRSNVPGFVIDRMYSQYLETLEVIKGEGFDSVFYYGSSNEGRLLREYYGIPNGIESFVDKIMSEVKSRWADGEYDSFTLPMDGLPLGYISIRPTTMNVRACYAMPPSSRYRPCILFIRPEIVFDDSDEDATLHATMVHELTHMFEDIGRRRSNEDGLGAELERLGYPKTFDNVITYRMFDKENEDNYSDVERAVNRVMFYGAGFERNARNAAMFTKLKDLPPGRIKTYDDAIKFLRSTTEFNRYERSVASAWFLVNLTDAKKQAEALSVVSQCSNYKFRNWNGFRKWLKGFIRRYEDKMKRVIPKMINHVINPPVSEGRLISEAQMNFDSLYYMRDGEDITEYVINYINWSDRGEFDPSFSVLASK